MAVLSDDELSEAMADLPGWDVDGDALVREVRFADFREAVAFVVRVAFEAEAANHHPDLDIRYNRVRVALSTHSEGGITAKDVSLASALSDLAPDS
jgi:4a-hydroxytetrahydrobiopterin dehydratase